MSASQPTLSVAVRKLEDELGVMLFERNAADVSVTPAGEKIVEQPLRVLEEAEVIKQIAEQGRDQLVGPLRLGAINTIGPYLFPDLIPNLHELAPDMPLFVEEDFTVALTEKLKQGQLDIIRALGLELAFTLPDETLVYPGTSAAASARRLCLMGCAGCVM